MAGPGLLHMRRAAHQPLPLQQRRGRGVPELHASKTLSQLRPYTRERDLEKSYSVSLALHRSVRVEARSKWL